MDALMSGDGPLISNGCGREIHNVSYSIYTVAQSRGERKKEKERGEKRERTRDCFATWSRQRRVLRAAKLKRSAVF